jgi:hypothetical protein
MDAYLAAFAISGSIRLITFDQDFRQFLKAGLDLELLQRASAMMLTNWCMPNQAASSWWSSVPWADRWRPQLRLR